jgi:hypothetical protein
MDSYIQYEEHQIPFDTDATVDRSYLHNQDELFQGFGETSVNFYKTTRSQSQNIVLYHSHDGENLKSN